MESEEATEARLQSNALSEEVRRERVSTNAKVDAPARAVSPVSQGEMEAQAQVMAAQAQVEAIRERQRKYRADAEAKSIADGKGQEIAAKSRREQVRT